MNNEVLNEEQTRLERLKTIQESGINPYPSQTEREITLAEARNSKEGTAVKVAGRLVSKREMGKLCKNICKT